MGQVTLDGKPEELYQIPALLGLKKFAVRTRFNGNRRGARVGGGAAKFEFAFQSLAIPASRYASCSPISRVLKHTGNL